jgi:hypothetical protein
VPQPPERDPVAELREGARWLDLVSEAVELAA